MTITQVVLFLKTDYLLITLTTVFKLADKVAEVGILNWSCGDGEWTIAGDCK